MDHDALFMQEALKEAQKAFDLDEVPVGAVLVKEQKIIARGHNQTIEKHDPTAHAEICVLREAGIVLNNYRLLDTTLYVTLEPCAMCAMALVHARVKRLVFATEDPRTGACGSVFNLVDHQKLNHRLAVEKNILQVEASHLLTSFFHNKRAK